MCTLAHTVVGLVQSAVLRSHVVYPSVCDVGGSWPHYGWKSWKLIARTISPTSSLFVAQRSSTFSKGNKEKFWGENVCSTPSYIHNVWLNCVVKSYHGGPIGSHQCSFEWYHPQPPTTSSSPRLGFTTPNQNPKLLLSHERLRLRISNFLCTLQKFQGNT